VSGPVEDIVLRAWGRGIRIDTDNPETNGTELVALLHEARNIDKVHPWHGFLRARMRCLAWLRDEMGKSPEQSVVTMRMDPEQVCLLLATYDSIAKGGE
jgi:acyl-coenzyme A synthetase/AMP-(fatty) acid ligase